MPVVVTRPLGFFLTLPVYAVASGGAVKPGTMGGKTRWVKPPDLKPSE